MAFTQEFRDLVKIAIEKATKWGHDKVDTDHLLMALMSSNNNLTYQLLDEITDAASIKSELEEKIRSTSGKIPLTPPPLTDNTSLESYAQSEFTKEAHESYKATMYRFVQDTSSPLYTSSYILMGILDEDNNVASNLLKKYGITIQKIVTNAEKYRAIPNQT
jgi:ATP-dependent Clp protease ATP-binding subunit ClpA